MGLEAKRKGVELMLCGQNADTMFGAIPYVKTLKRCGDLHKMTAPIKPLLKVASSILPATYKSRASFIVNYDLPRSFLWLKTGFYRDPPHSPRYTWLRGDFYETVDEKNLLNKIKAFEIDLDGDIADRLILFDERYTEAPRCVEAIKKPASVETMLPYYDETLIRTALQVPTKYRAESSWDKMILRDAFKPVVHPLIYKRPMKSLVFPLFKWLEPEVLCNIKGDEFIENIVDLDFLVRERKNVKELLWAEVVFKTLVLFVWYDVFFSKGTVSKKILKSIFK
jgi:asparagine synthetase B (glutamine-hydrolysing)